MSDDAKKPPGPPAPPAPPGPPGPPVPPAGAGPRIQLQVDDDIGQGVYTNLVLINHTENEFVLDFAFLQPGNPRAKVRSRVISGPKHTKRLLLALQRNIEVYEKRFGEIELGDEPEVTVH